MLTNMNVTQEVKKDRFHFLDGVRAIASVLIVIHHSFSSEISKTLARHGMPYLGNSIGFFTQSGVALFFVLSGVVLLRPYLRGQRTLNAGDYFLRRLKRIYPPYFVALIFGYLVVYTIKQGPHTFYSDVWKWADLSFLRLAKMTLIVNFTDFYYNLAWWSLQIEVVFYMLVPLLIPMFRGGQKLNLVKVFVTLFVVLGLSYALQMFMERYHPELYSNLKLRLTIYRFIDYPVCFLLGIYLAKFDFEKYVGRVFMALGVALILVAHNYLPMVNCGYGFVYAGLIVVAFKSKALQRMLDNPLMIWLGERSYSLFLVHFSVFYLVDYCCSLVFHSRLMYGIASRAIGIPLALFCAMLLFSFVERRTARGLVTDKIFWPWQLGRLKKEQISD